MHVQSCFANMNLLLVYRSCCHLLSFIFCFHESRTKKRDWLGDRFVMPRNVLENFTNSALASLIFPYLAMGVNNYPIFGQWRHCFAFTPRVSRPGDSVCYCSLWTMVCVCWVFAEDLTGEQAYIFLFKRAISVLFYVVATSTRIPTRWNRILDICVNTNSVPCIWFGSGIQTNKLLRFTFVNY